MNLNLKMFGYSFTEIETSCSNSASTRFYGIYDLVLQNVCSFSNGKTTFYSIKVLVLIAWISQPWIYFEILLWKKCFMKNWQRSDEFLSIPYFMTTLVECFKQCWWFSKTKWQQKLKHVNGFSRWCPHLSKTLRQHFKIQLGNKKDLLPFLKVELFPHSKIKPNSHTTSQFPQK